MNSSVCISKLLVPYSTQFLLCKSIIRNRDCLKGNDKNTMFMTPQNAIQNSSRTKSVMGKPSILISFIVTSYARTDKYILCLGCWIFMAILQGWMRKDKGKSIMPHNKKNTTELKYVRWKVSQLHKKVAYTALVENQNMMFAQVHAQHSRNRTSVNTRDHWGSDKYFVYLIYLIRKITCQAITC